MLTVAEAARWRAQAHVVAVQVRDHGGQNVEEVIVSANLSANFEALWKTFDEKYSHFGVKNVDWQAVYRLYCPKVTATTTDSTRWVLNNFKNSLKSSVSSGASIDDSAHDLDGGEPFGCRPRPPVP
jgi:hypothetical protein